MWFWFRWFGVCVAFSAPAARSVGSGGALPALQLRLRHPPIASADLRSALRLPLRRPVGVWRDVRQSPVKPECA